MKILHTVEFYYPSVGGAQEVVRQLSQRLVLLGHEVTVATSKLPGRSSLNHNGVNIVEFEISGNAVRGYTGDTRAYKDFLVAGDYDIVMNYAAQQWATDLFFEVIDSIKAAKVLVPCGFSGLFDPNYKRYFLGLPHYLKKYDATVYLSEDYRDINFAREHGVKNIQIIPNGAGADEFDGPPSANIRSMLKIPYSHFLILSVGSHTDLKGHREAIEIFKCALIKNATLLIIGNDFGEGCGVYCRQASTLSRLNPILLLRHKRILSLELSRPLTVDAFKAADLFLFPSNVEASPLVLFEAMASKLPFLTTDVGNSSEIIDWSGGGLLLPTIVKRDGLSVADVGKSAAMLEDVYMKKTGPALGERGYRAWKRRFSWEMIAGQYESLYRSLLR